MEGNEKRVSVNYDHLTYFDESWYSVPMDGGIFSLSDRKMSTYINALAKAGFMIEEMLEDEQAVILAEWPDPLAQMMPQDRLEMDFVLEGGDKRRITLRAGGAVSRALAEGLCR